MPYDVDLKHVEPILCSRKVPFQIDLLGPLLNHPLIVDPPHLQVTSTASLSKPCLTDNVDQDVIERARFKDT